MKWLQVLTCEPIKEILWRGSSQLGTTFNLSTQIVFLVLALILVKTTIGKEKIAKILSSDLIGENLCNQPHIYELVDFSYP